MARHLRGVHNRKFNYEVKGCATSWKVNGKSGIISGEIKLLQDEEIKMYSNCEDSECDMKFNNKSDLESHAIIGGHDGRFFFVSPVSQEIRVSKAPRDAVHTKNWNQKRKQLFCTCE